ncbi:SGNH/GDSL hydrolase family protein [Microlunatus antarcticus]|uniref:Lysophospholipase L1-like esterase n=1 Tax=Microlunatus antarcticus TaxID=53388 RepID=A0A7W5JY13_9ACTN|nr:lysophospholipase L1-like esterase [Microlunatus antarcticus]
MSRRSRARTRLGLAVVATLAVLGLVSGCSTPAAPPAPEPTCTLPDPRPTLVPGSLVLPKNPDVLVLGDSYTEGYGAEPETKGWAYLVGKPLGWKVTVNGVGGTGYVNPGPRNEGTYLQRLAGVQGGTFDLVVLQGGSNDRDTPYLALTDAVSRTVDAVRAKFPGTAVLLMGPATPYGKPDGPRLVAQCVLAGYGTQQHLPFVDPLAESWFVDGDGSRYANPVNGHPSNAGYRVIAGRFETDVRVLLGTTKRS